MILTQQILDKINFLYPAEADFETITKATALQPFDNTVCSLLAAVSQILLKEGKGYPDVVSFAFWCRKASIESMAKKYITDFCKGRGLLFHITPSNVPVNFAYSLVAGLLAGNINIVRVPSKDFPQINLIVDAFRKVLEQPKFCLFKPYINFIRYERDDSVNVYLSSLCDVRIIWGGDQSISEIRKAPLNARAYDVVFADRYSFCVINAAFYLKQDNKPTIAQNFYNDTYLFDQNACTAPHLVVWLGSDEDTQKAKDFFWTELHKIVAKKYTMQPVQAVDKLTTMFKSAIETNSKYHKTADNLIVRVSKKELTPGVENYTCNGGFFTEYSTEKLQDVLPVLNRKYQTIGYLGVEKEELCQFVQNNGFYGIDRIVPIGKTMDFSLTWDGYDLINAFTRKIDII